MAYPTQPTIVVARGSPTTFTVTVSGADIGTTERLYYRKIGSAVDNVGDTRLNNGVILAPGTTGPALETNAAYLVWVVSDNGSSYSLPAIASVSLLATNSLLGSLVSAAQLFLPLMNLATGGIWVGQVPETIVDGLGNNIPVPTPVVAIDHNGEVPDWTFENVYSEEGNVSFLVFAETAATAETVATQVKACFDWTQTLSFADPNVVEVSIQRTNYIVKPTPERSKTGEIVFRVELPYTTYVKRSL